MFVRSGRITASNIYPNYDNEYARWMESHPWTHMLTLSDVPDRRFGMHGVDPSIQRGSDFQKTVDAFFYRLGDRVFGREKYKRRMPHATFFENLTKSGIPTFWHSHSLVMVPPSFVGKFSSEIEKQWNRLKRRVEFVDGNCCEVPRGIRIKPINEENGGLLGACRYCTKFSHIEILPMMAVFP